MPDRPSPTCSVCGLTAEDLKDCYPLEPGETASEFVRREEGTYNPTSNAFVCDECYIAIGMPSNPYPQPNWTAP